jgi:hypothetical protein
MNARDARAMFELQLELHARAVGRRPNITADDVLEVHERLVTHEGDLKSLFPRRVRFNKKVPRIEIGVPGPVG